MISVGTDSKICVWKCDKNNDHLIYKNWTLFGAVSSSCKDSSAINALTTLFINEKEKYFAIFTTSGILQVFKWVVEENNYISIYSNKIKGKLQETIKLDILDEQNILLYTGGNLLIIKVMILTFMFILFQEKVIQISNIKYHYMDTLIPLEILI